jgi:hypothetical protein
MAEQKSSSAVSEFLRNAASAVRRVPGVGAVTDLVASNRRRR